MKKFVSCLLIVAMLAGMLSVLPAVAASDETLSVRVVQDFDDASRTEAGMSYDWAHNVTDTYEAVGVGGSAALKLVTKAGSWWKWRVFGYDSATMGAADKPWRSDWSGVEYVQFYVDNQGEGAAHVTYRISDHNGRMGGYEYYQFNDNTVIVQVKSLGTGTWEDVTATANGDGMYGYSVPAGFKGLVRIEFNLDKMASAWNNYEKTKTVGAMMLAVNAEATTLVVDEVALVGDLPSELGTQYTEEAYWKHLTGESESEPTDPPATEPAPTQPAVAKPDDDVRVVQDFAESSRTDAGMNYDWAHNVTDTYEAVGVAGSEALKLVTNAGSWWKWRVFAYNSGAMSAAEKPWRSDWSGVEYVQFYVDNQGAGAAHLTYRISDHSDRMGSYEYYQFNDNTVEIQVKSLEAGTWEDVTATANGDGMYGYSIPAGFKGLVRIEFNLDKMTSAWNNYEKTRVVGALMVVVNAEATTLVLDDVALVGDLPSEAGTQYTKDEYWAHLTGAAQPDPTDPPVTEPAPTDPPATEPEESKPVEMKPDDDVRVVQDFADSSRTEAGMSYDWAHNVTDTYESVGVVGSKALKLVTKAGSWWKWRVFGYNSATMGAAEKPWRTDWSGVEYVQFYVDNQGAGAAHLTYRISDHSDRMGSYEYYQFNDNTVVIHVMSLETGKWENVPATANGDGMYGYSVPAGFKGLVRIEFNLDKMTSAWNNYTKTTTVGAMMVVINAEATTLVLDEVALVGDLPAELGTQYTKEAYWDHLNGEPEPEPTEPPATEPEPTEPPATEPEETEPAGPKPDIIVLQDFTDKSRTEANMKYDWAHGLTDSYEAVGIGSSKALKLVATSNNAWWKWLIYGYSSSELSGGDLPWRTKWNNVEYVQFYVDNQGQNAAHITYRISDNNGRMGAYEYLTFMNDDVKIQVMSLETGKWQTVKATADADGQYGYTVPAGFKGLVRIEFAPEKMQSAWSNVKITDTVGALMLAVNMDKTTLVVDDVALVGFFEGKVQGHQYTDEEYKKVLAGEDVGTNERVEITMPDGLANINTVLDFENGISDIHSGINQIPAEFSQSNEWSATGNFALKLVGTGIKPGADHITQIQPQVFVADTSSAYYLEFAVKNGSNVPFGITWIKFNGNSSVSYLTDEIAIYEDGKWYSVEAYDAEAFAIPAGYEGKIRIKISLDIISKFEMAVKELTATQGATLYLDTFCIIGEPVVYEEVEMPTDLDLIKTVMDFEKVNLTSIKSGINFLPITFSLTTEASHAGQALKLTTGTGGSIPNLSQVQPGKFYQNWTGGQYLELWISNPNAVDFAFCWSKIGGVDYNTLDTEISLQMADGKWYKAQTGGDANGAIIPAGFSGKIRVKLDEKFGDLVMVENLEFAIWCATDIAGQVIYIDSIVVLGNMEAHDEPEVPNAVSQFPVEAILEKIASGQTEIHYEVSANIPVPVEILEAIRGKDIIFSYTVVDQFGLPLYRWILVGKEVKDVTEFYPTVSLDAAAMFEGAVTKSFTVSDGAVAGAYLSVNVRKDFPAFTKMFVYTVDEAKQLSNGDQVNASGWFSVALEKDGTYLLADTIITSYSNPETPTEPPVTEPETELPGTGDRGLSMAIALLLTSAGVMGIMLRKRKEH